MDVILLCGVIFLLSVVQSIFGVGLLVFGTPTLLMLGHDFGETLALLLPCSVLVSSLQVYGGFSHIKSLKYSFLIYCLPFVLGGLIVGYHLGFDFDMKIYVGAMLVVTGLIRSSSKLLTIAENFLRKKQKVYMALMGIMHGLTNMGGGFLTILIGTLYRDKREIRANVGYGYLLMGIIQLITIIFLYPGAFKPEGGLYVLITLATYLILGNRIFQVSKQKHFHHLITAITFVYGVVLLIP